MENAAPILVAIGSLMAIIGGAFKWLWNKVELRSIANEARFTAIEKALEECRTDGSIKLTVIELMWQEIEQLAPNSPVLRRVKRLLDGLKKTELEHG